MTRLTHNWQMAGDISRPTSISGVCKHPGFHTKHAWQMKVHPLQIWNILRSFNPSSFGISYGFVAQYPYCVNWYADFCWLISPLLPLQSLFLLVKSIFLWMMSTSQGCWCTLLLLLWISAGKWASLCEGTNRGCGISSLSSWLQGSLRKNHMEKTYGKITAFPLHNVITRINEEMDVECPWFPQFPPMLLEIPYGSEMLGLKPSQILALGNNKPSSVVHYWA